MSSYVLDLLSDADAEAWIREARRLLRPGGTLGLVGLGTGCGSLSKLLASIWTGVHRWSPVLVGGCRPQEVLHFLPPSDWEIEHGAQLTIFGLASEVVIARRK